jgi:hypothetical protein
MSVYHFTSTIALPWILAHGELRPSTQGHVQNHQIWATSNPKGECSARPLRHKWRDEWFPDDLQLIRLTLPDAGFISWAEYQLTMLPEDVAEWEAMAVADNEDSSAWRLRRDPLPLKSVLRADAMAFGHSGWTRIKHKLLRKYCREVCDDPLTMACSINGFEYYSTWLGDDYFVPPDRSWLTDIVDFDDRWK